MNTKHSQYETKVNHLRPLSSRRYTYHFTNKDRAKDCMERKQEFITRNDVCWILGGKGSRDGGDGRMKG